MATGGQAEQVHALPPGALGDRTLFLGGPEARHILKALRRGVGDRLQFSDGEGRFVHATIDRVDGGELHAVVDRIEDDPLEAGAPRLLLGLPLLKGDHFELALEKATELGVHGVIPLLAERCVVRWKERSAARKLERFDRITEGAMKQCRRSWWPRVHAPVAPADLAAAVPGGTQWVVADEEADATGVDDLGLDPARPVLALVGPEGAFSPAEKDQLAQAGARAVRLSPYRLRSETAAITLVAALAGAARGRLPWR